MADVKNYGLTGVAPNVQFGKAGPRLKATDGSHLAARDPSDDALVNVKAAPASAADDVVVKAQLDSLASNVTAMTGFTLALGDVAAQGDGSWAPGAVPLTNDVKVASAIDSLNEVLAKLVPAQPPAFPNGTLTITGTTGQTPVLAAGGVTDNAGGTSGYTPGSAVTRIATATFGSNTFGDVGPGDTGTLSLSVNGSVVGSKALTGTGDNGTYTGLVIADQKDFPTTTPGFWKSMDVSVSGAAAPVGINKFSLAHSGAGSTNVVHFVRDSLTANPAMSAGSVVQAAAGTLAYSSSVPHYGTGATLTVGLSMTNLSGETYYGGSDPLALSGTNGTIASQSYGYTAIGVTTPIAKNTTAATALTPVTLNVNGSNVFAVGNVQAVLKNVVGSTSAANVTGTNILVMNGSASGKVYEMSIPVTGLGTNPNGNNAVRVGLGTGDAPAGSTTAWVATDALPTHEAAVVAGVLGHNKTDYSTGYLPVGPNLSTGRDGAQYVTFQFQRAAVSTFKIVLTGSYAGCWVKLLGVSDNAAISPAATNGWWNAYKPYDGAGVPGESGDSDAGCALGTVMAGAGGTFVITFGTQSSTNATGNTILVRFKLTSGQSITALSFTN